MFTLDKGECPPFHMGVYPPFDKGVCPPFDKGLCPPIDKYVHLSVMDYIFREGTMSTYR